MTTTNTTPLNPRTISRSHLKQMMDRKASFTLVDVLDGEDFNESHLPDAVNVPLNERFETAIAVAVPDKNRKVIVYCASESCDASTKAAQRLVTLGYQHVSDFKGGKQAWQDGNGTNGAPNASAAVASGPVPVAIPAVAIAN